MNPDSPRSAPPEAWAPLFRMARMATRPIERFLHIEAASGILLLVAAAVALVAANSQIGPDFAAFWDQPVGIRIGTFACERSLLWIVNDGFMVVFFFVVGLEIRREIHQGELSDLRRAALPIVIAAGGMAAPALVYLAFAGATTTRSGWAVPTATDIAFAVGVLALLGRRVPPALRVLLLAVAVIDDLGAILVIAFFYSTGVSSTGLLVAGGGIAGILILRATGVRSRTVYVLPGLVVWAGTYAAGIHPTIAGVIIGLLTPVKAWIGSEGFVVDARSRLDRLSGDLARAGAAGTGTHALAGTLTAIDRARREAVSPAEGLIDGLHPWVAFLVMPVFALANAGVALGGGSSDGGTTDVLLGVSAGLVLGKPFGMLAVGAIALKTGFARLPSGLGMRHLVVLGFVGGIGFTMSLFIAQLAFADPDLLAAAKTGVLAASAIAACAGLAAGRFLLALPKAQTQDPAQAGDVVHGTRQEANP